MAPRASKRSASKAEETIDPGRDGPPPAHDQGQEPATAEQKPAKRPRKQAAAAAAAASAQTDAKPASEAPSRPKRNTKAEPKPKPSPGSDADAGSDPDADADRNSSGDEDDSDGAAGAKNRTARAGAKDSKKPSKAKAAAPKAGAGTAAPRDPPPPAPAPAPGPRYFLMKSEPEEFSLDDLAAKPNQTSHWEGVRNAQARNIMRSMRLGDQALFYHSSCKVPAAVGVVRVVREAYPDHFAFDKSSKYHDPSSSPDSPKWWMVDVQLVRRLARPVTLAELRQEGARGPPIRDMVLINKSRLSVQPVSEEQWRRILELELEGGEGGEGEGATTAAVAKKGKEGKEARGKGKEGGEVKGERKKGAAAAAAQEEEEGEEEEEGKERAAKKGGGGGGGGRGKKGK
ncbi:hypothetical protein PLESTF_000687200 [Pleodorina starrii]|nr:hypothetical protein PLESTF_000687200 [Pleodorina starrii]